MDEKNIFRKCISCNTEKSRDELIKVTLNKSTGEIEVCPDSKFFGRSVYICKDFGCVETAFKKGRIYKFLKIKPQDSLKEKIRAVLEN